MATTDCREVVVATSTAGSGRRQIPEKFENLMRDRTRLVLGRRWRDRIERALRREL